MTGPQDLAARGAALVARVSATFAARRAGLVTQGEMNDMLREINDSARALELDRRRAWGRLAA